MQLIIRSETAQDYKAIYALNELAFEQNNESILIEQLRKRDDFIPELSLVAEIAGTIVGHMLLLPLSIMHRKKSHTVLSLAPMAVHPKYQSKGIGGKLIKAGKEKAKELGYKAIVVLGHPCYYPKFGFERASKHQIKPPEKNIPDEAFMVLELEYPALKNIAGTVQFPQEYYNAL